MFKLMFSEFSKLAASKGVLFAVILSLFVPVAYGGISLSATWSPMDQLHQLPVAVVNNDRGAIQDDEPLNVGNQLVDTLKSQDGLGWEFVDTSEAMRGLQNHDYYMVVVIPEDFSERAITVMDEDPLHLELEYIQNEGLNYLAGSITNTAMETIREQLADTITKTYVTTVFDSLDQIAEGFQEAADGSEQLHDGTNQLYESVSGKSPDIKRLADGAGELKSGTNQIRHALSSGQSDISRLANGSAELYAGTRQVLDGLKQAEPGSRELRDGLAQLAPGGKDLHEGMIKAEDGVKQLADGAKKLAEGVKTYQNSEILFAGGLLKSQFDEIVDGAGLISAGLNELLAGAGELRDGSGRLSAGLNQAYDGSKDLSSGLKQLLDGQQEIVDGAKQIADGNRQVNSGWQELTAGASQIDDGMGQVSDGTSQVNTGWGELEDGAGQLKDGSEQLAEGLKGGAEQTAGLNTNEENAEMFAAPVKLANEKVNQYEYYRDTTAPYIMTLALFAGILIMSLFIKFKRPEDVSSLKWFMAKYMKLGLLSIAQAILLMLVVLIGLNLSVDNLLGFILFSFVVALAFSAIVMFLASAFGNFGRFLALVFVIMQLGITGADLPREMLPYNLQSLSDILPFTYSIEGFKGVILLDDFGYALSNIWVLLIYLALGAALAWIALMFNKKKVQTPAEDAGLTM